MKKWLWEVRGFKLKSIDFHGFDILVLTARHFFAKIATRKYSYLYFRTLYPQFLTFS